MAKLSRAGRIEQAAVVLRTGEYLEENSEGEFDAVVSLLKDAAQKLTDYEEVAKSA